MKIGSRKKFQNSFLKYNFTICVSKYIHVEGMLIPVNKMEEPNNNSIFCLFKMVSILLIEILIESVEKTKNTDLFHT